MTRGCPYLDLGGLQLKIDCLASCGDEHDCFRDVLWFDPDVPAVQVCPKLGSVIKFVLGFFEDGA